MDVERLSSESYDQVLMEDLTPPAHRYTQIAQRLRAAIIRGEHPPGQTIPSEAHLADLYRVSRTVVRQAIALLQAEGLLTVEHGRGTFVRRRAPLFHRGRLQYDRSDQAPGQSAFEASVLKSLPGATTRRELTAVEKVPAPAEVAGRLALPDGEEVWMRRHLFWVNQEPVELQDGYFPISVAEDTLLTQRQSTPSGLQAFFEDTLGLTIERVAEDVESRMPSPDEARRLHLLPGVPLLAVWRTRWADNNRPIEATISLFPSDRWRLNYEMSVRP